MSKPQDSNTGKSINYLLEKATDDFQDISDIHHKLLKLGYNKNFTAFFAEIKARATWRELLKK